MDNKQLQPEKHKCGQCEAEFDSEEAYLNHTCKSTGFNPTNPQHLGEDFKAISEAALARGEEQTNPKQAIEGEIVEK